MKQLLEKYGYRSISLTLRQYAADLPGTEDSKHLLLEMANDLETALKEAYDVKCR